MTEVYRDPRLYFEPELEIVDDINVDRFGVNKVYPDLNDGEKYEMNIERDPRDDSGFHSNANIEKNSDGSFKIKSEYGRINIYTSSKYDEKGMELNHTQLASRGYMLEPNDYRNLEATVYMRVNEANKQCKFVFSARGGMHTDSNMPGACEGSAYKINLDCNEGKIDFVKEQWHGSYALPKTNNKNIGRIIGKWVGFKGIVYNLLSSYGVKLEVYADVEDTNSWIKVDEIIDGGGWGDQGEKCGGKADQIINWGGPKVKFEWYSTLDVDFKKLSVREIMILNI